MASTTQDTVWSREQIVEELKALRRSKIKNYKFSVNLLVKKNYNSEEAKAILIYLATTSLDETDQIIVLGAWRLLPGYQTLDLLQDRRIKVKEAIQYKGEPESLDNRENKAFGVIVDSFFVDFSNPERWEIIAQAALKEHYDSEKKKAILPELSFAVSTESAASAGDTTKKHQAEPANPNILSEPETVPVAEGPLVATVANEGQADDKETDAIMDVPIVTAEAATSTDDTTEKHQAEPVKPSIPTEPETAPATEEPLIVTVVNEGQADDKKTRSINTTPNKPKLKKSVAAASKKRPGKHSIKLSQKPRLSKAGRREVTKVAVIGMVIMLITITIVLFTSFASYSYTVDLTARFDGNKTWSDELYHARVGDMVQLQLKFVNDRGILSPFLKYLGDKLGLSIGSHDVMVRFFLPDNLEYIENSTIVYNSGHPDGIYATPDTAITTGINVGNYAVGGDVYVRLYCRVVNNSLKAGENLLVAHANATVADQVKHDEGVSIHLVY